jgi:trans-aconitate 2-methyltransferase
VWDPGQYNRFAAEREQPFWDLAALLEPVVRPRVVDLGCGDGRLTATLHERLGAASTLGVDSSREMLAEAEQYAGETVSFELGDIGLWTGSGFQIVFSNAAIQWVGDHPTVLARWRAALEPSGQLAVQMPDNADAPSHEVARVLGAERLGSAAPPDPVEQNVLAPERYSELLDKLGFERQHVRLQVYPHKLASSADVVEWVKGTSLTRFKSSFSEAEYERFLDDYRTRLLAQIGEHSPYLYPFKRILIWGRLP